MEGPYNFNCYPLAPLGTRAIIYKDSDTQASHRPHMGWTRGTRAHQRTTTVATTITPPKPEGIEYLDLPTCFHKSAENHCTHITATSGNSHLNSKKSCLPPDAKPRHSKSLNSWATPGSIYLRQPPPPAPEQRVGDEGQRVLAVIGQEERPAIQRVSTAPPTMLANNPTSKRVLQARPHTHQRTTRCNTPGTLPKITRPKIAPPIQDNTQTQSTAPYVITNKQQRQQRS